ncbi:MAG: PQQ-dependent sugar dehydrogenase [Bacteroidia bacterium]|nr:PQQ-dependent sugar dehydrogenase [Bacteroidia bacterium]
MRDISLSLFNRPNRLKFRLFVIALFFSGAAFVPLFMPPPGLSTPEPIGAFLNGSLPDITPGGGEASWGVAPVYPNLTFRDPMAIVPSFWTNRIFVASRQGKIESFVDNPNVNTKTTVLDLTQKVGVVPDGGFMGMALHPDFGRPGNPNRRHFYVYYVAKGDNGDFGPTTCGAGCFSCFDNANWYGSYLRLSRFSVDENTLIADPNSEVIMFNIRQYNGTHRGGGMIFGNDNYLYVTIGDQARYEGSQNIVDNFEGGLVRLDINKLGGNTSHAPRRKMGVETGNPDEFSGVGYFIPNDNPWQSPNNTEFEEFYAIGLRNPFKIGADRQTGELWIGDVGQDSREEIDLVKKGGNYGWPVYEGNIGPASNWCSFGTTLGIGTYEPPVTDFLRTEMNSITGGHVYRGALFPSLQGKYICGGYAQKRIFAVEKNGTKTVLTSFTPGSMISIGLDTNSELIMGRQGFSSNLYKLTTTANNPPAPSLLSQTGAFKNLSTLEPSDGVIPYDMIESFWSDGASKQRWLAVPNDGSHDTPQEQIQFSEQGDWKLPQGAVLIKHFELFGKRLETRFEVLGTDDIHYFLTYKWNAQGTDASLLNGALDETVTGNGQSQVWHYPSQSECINCHQESAGSVLGLKTRYLNKDILYPKTGNTGNQLVTLSHLGILDETIVDSDLSTLLTASASSSSASLEKRARSYLDLNCSYCHRPGTGNRAAFDARLSTPLTQQNLINGSVVNTLGNSDARVIVPQSLPNSILYQRINSLADGVAMPPLAKGKIDVPGVQVVADWINSLVPADTRDLVRVGSATEITGGCYEITPKSANQIGAVWYPDSLDLNEDFNITFGLNLGDEDQGAEGVAFVLQNQGKNIIGTGGPGHGATGITPSVAISFDTHGQNEDEMFIWKNGDRRDFLANRTCLDEDCENVENDNSYSVEIDWNSTTQTLDVYFGGSLRRSYTGDLINDIFGGNPLIYVGLTAATNSGPRINSHKVCNFNLNSETNVSRTPFISDNFVEVYPNPASSRIRVSYKDGIKHIRGIRMLDMAGRTVRNYEDINAFEFEIRRYNLNSGMYILQVELDAGIVNKKILFD